MTDLAAGDLPPIIVTARKLLLKSLDQFEASRGRYEAEEPRTSRHRKEQAFFARGKDARATAKRQVWQAGNTAASYAALSAVDHIRCTAALFSGTRVPLYAPSTLARGACEAAALVRHFMDKQIDTELQLLRFGASILYDHRERIRGVGKFPPDLSAARTSILAEHEAERDAFVQRLADCGFTVAGQNLQSKSGVTVSIRPSFAKLADELLPSRGPYYNSLSGIAHGRPWALFGVASGTDADGVPGVTANLLELGAAALLELEVIAVLDALWAEYYGADPEPAARRYRTQVQAVDVAMKDAFLRSRNR